MDIAGDDIWSLGAVGSSIGAVGMALWAMIMGAVTGKEALAPLGLLAATGYPAV